MINYSYIIFPNINTNTSHFLESCLDYRYLNLGKKYSYTNIIYLIPIYLILLYIYVNMNLIIH